MKKTSVIPVKKTDLDRDEAEAQSARIKAVFVEGEAGMNPKCQQKGTVAPTDSLRKRILSLSLFPNPYNREYIKKYSS